MDMDHAMPELDAARRARLLELFDYYDVRQNSVLEDDELRCCLLEAGLELPGEELEKVMRAAGAAAHTSATREQFLAIVAQLERGGGGGGDGRRCSTPQQRRAFEEWVSADGDPGAAFPSRMTEAATPRTRAATSAQSAPTRRPWPAPAAAARRS